MRTRTLFSALVLGAVLAGCGDGGTGPGDRSLTRAQAVELHAALFAMGAGFAEGEIPGMIAGNRVPGAPRANENFFAYSFDQPQPCVPSGFVRVKGSMTGTWDDAAQTSVFGAELSVTHNDCAVQTEDGGVFTLSGDPDIDVTLETASDIGGLASLRITEKGAFTWENDGGSGRCTVDVVAELVSATGALEVSGSFCGFPVDETFMPEE